MKSQLLSEIDRSCLSNTTEDIFSCDRKEEIGVETDEYVKFE